VEIVEWLQQLGFERYEEAFRGNEITAAVLPELRIPVTTNESDYARGVLWRCDSGRVDSWDGAAAVCGSV